MKLWSKIVIMKNENDPRGHLQFLFLLDSYLCFRFPWPIKTFPCDVKFSLQCIFRNSAKYDFVNGRNDYYSHLANKTYKHLSRKKFFNDKHLQILTYNLIFTLFYSIKNSPLIMLCATSRSSSAKCIVKV